MRPTATGGGWSARRTDEESPALHTHTDAYPVPHQCARCHGDADGHTDGDQHANANEYPGRDGHTDEYADADAHQHANFDRHADFYANRDGHPNRNQHTDAAPAGHHRGL